MDNLTHSLVGALLGQAGLKRKTGLAMPALIIGANLPDVDAACFFWLDGVEHLGFRRGITHGPPALVLLPLMLAGLLWWFDRWQARRGKRPDRRRPVSFKWLFLLSFIGCLTHPALDWLNVYGIRLLEPYSSQWFYGDTLFIIDVWLWAIMGLGLWFSLRREKRGKSWRWPAVSAILLSLTYILANWIFTNASFVPFGINQKVVPTEENGLGPKPAIPTAQMIASPIPFNPFGRELIVGQKNQYFIIRPDVIPSPWSAHPITMRPCLWPSNAQLSTGGSQSAAFLFWSRAPFAERAPDGSVLLRDARFYDPLARDRFTVALPDVKCEPLTVPSP